MALAPLGDVLVALPLAEGVGRSDLGERDDVDVNDSDHARGRPGGVEDELSVTGRRQPSPGIGLVVGQQGRRRSLAARQDRRREPVAQRTGERGLPRREQLPPRGQPGRPRTAAAGGAEEHGRGVVELRAGPDSLHADAGRHALRGDVLRVRDGDDPLHPRVVHGVEDGPRGLGDITVPAMLGHLPPADLQHGRRSPAR